MYSGKIIVPTDTLTPPEIEELESQFENLRWVSDKVIMLEFGPGPMNPIDTHIWPTGTRIILGWEQT